MNTIFTAKLLCGQVENVHFPGVGGVASCVRIFTSLLQMAPRQSVTCVEKVHTTRVACASTPPRTLVNAALNVSAAAMSLCSIWNVMNTGDNSESV